MSTTSTPIITTLQNPPINQRTDSYKLVVDCLGNQLREYHIDRSQYISQQKVFKWRQRTHHPIIKVTPIQQSMEKGIVCLRCEHAVVSLKEVGMMRIQEVVYCMSEMLLGYQEVLNRLGYVCVEEGMIGLNHKGEILLWVNSNPVVNSGGSFQLIRQQLILLRILQIMSRKSSSHNRLFFQEIKSTPKTFTSYLDFLMQFKHKHKLKIIPRINVKRVLIANNHIRAISNNSIQLVGKDHQQHVGRSLKLIGSKTTHLISQNQIQQGLITSASTNFIRSPHINHTFIPKLTMPKQGIQSPSQSHVLTISQAKSNDNLFAPSMVGSVGYFNSTKSSFIQNDNTTEINTLGINNNGNNLRKPHRVKSSMKINFSYSQKRNDLLLTPRQETVARDYTSDKQLCFMSRFQQPQAVQQFTLLDLRRQQVDDSNRKSLGVDKLDSVKGDMLMKQSKRRIVPSYSIVYSPEVGIVNLRTELQLKRSNLSALSSNTGKSGQDNKRGPFNKISVCDNKHNKTSMTTNHRSVTQSFQSLDNHSNQAHPDYTQNYSNCDNYDNTTNYFSNAPKNYRHKDVLRSTTNQHCYGLGRKAHNNMFASDSSCLVSSSVIGGEEGVKNTKSILINQSQLIDDAKNNTNENLYVRRAQSSSSDTQEGVISSGKILTRDNVMYTFGGLIVPATQIKLLQQSQNLLSQVKSSPSKLSTSAIQQPSRVVEPMASQPKQSIEQFYKAINLGSQKKSVIVSQAYHTQFLKQTYQVNYNLIGTPITPSKQNQQTHPYNSLSPAKYYSLNNPQREEEFDYNNWRGLKGLLNQSNVYELKQSIHCGPEVRAPVDFKLQLLDKFGREVTHSILPATPNRKYSSSCVKSVILDQHQ